MKSLKTNLFLSFFLAGSFSAHALATTCKALNSGKIPGYASSSDCPNCSAGEAQPISGTWDDAPREQDFGATFTSDLGAVPSGNDLVYDGPAIDGTIVKTKGRSFSGIRELSAFMQLEFSTDWRPTTHNECNDHKWDIWKQKDECVGWTPVNDPTSFTVDIVHTTNVPFPLTTHRRDWMGRRVRTETTMVNRLLPVTIYSNTWYNVNKETVQTISLPNISCDGDVQNLHVRIRDAKGGSLNFKVHSLKADYGYLNK